MPCYHPMRGYRSRADGKTIVFNPTYGWVDRPLTIPCGQCRGCRLERSRQWAVRCVHEASLHEDNCFITLTYNNENLPEDGSLNKKHFQDFMKRLRKKYKNKKIRYYHCGEYGDKNFRPHYHAIIFGLDFDDQKLFKIINGEKLYTSEKLEKLWPFGFSTIGSVTFESAAYVARYVMKKVNGKNAKNHYERVNNDTGEIYNLVPEYNTMSRRPGIAARWFDKYKDDVYPSDNIHLREKTFRPPKFYDRMYEHLMPDEMEKIKKRRMIKMAKHADDNTAERLAVKEQVKIAQLNKLIRSI
jgi:hypothetical protein